jgi:integrase
VYFKIASFQKVVKILKHYINILQKERLLPQLAINTNHFEAADYISRSTNRDSYTKIEFTLEFEEIEQLLTASFEDPKMQLATDMYIIQMFAGGLRPVEMYNGNIRFADNYVSFYRSKNKKVSKNPILPEVRDILDKYPEGLPKFLNISTYREKLKEVARHLKWKRIITEPETRINSKKDVIEYELHEIFSPLTARKTFINYLANLGLEDEKIIQFTDQSDVKILKHYKKKLNLQQKRSLIQKLLEDLNK